MGIVGLPNVGKSTLFNALTKAGVPAANYPFTTIDSSVGVVPVPDPRLERLAALFGSARVTPATVTFVDIAGLVRGASRGEGLGNRFLGNIREVDAFCHVVRAFQAGDVAHVEEGVDPRRDIGIVETELALADLETLERRLPRLEKEATVDRALASRVELLGRLREVVAAGDGIVRHPDLMELRSEFADLHLMTAKPTVFVFNCDESLRSDPKERGELASMVEGSESVFLDARLEVDLTDLAPEERMEYLAATGQAQSGVEELIEAAFRALGLQTFLTGNRNEARAWTLPVGSTAHQAAGVVHTDFQRGFVGADVADFADLDEAGSWAEARARGLVRTEGRSYVMSPDDVVEFRYNV